MNKTYLIGFFVLLLSTSFVLAQGNSGAIWTTRSDCGNQTQNANHYAVGETIWINGANFDTGNYDWDITGLPGQASCDPGIAVASGQVVVDETGAFCFEAYVVAIDDCGEYKAAVGNKHDNYRVRGGEPIVPEFGLIAGALAVAGAGLFIYFRRSVE